MAGFGSHDAGGPYRESFSLVCQDLQSQRTKLFIPSPNNLQNVGSMRDAWIPNPAAKVVPGKNTHTIAVLLHMPVLTCG